MNKHEKYFSFLLSLCLLFVSVSSLVVFADSSYDPYGNISGADWHLDKINVSDAWNKGFVGSSSTVVAVIDTGVSNHSDLTNNVDFSLARCINNNTYTTNYTDVIGHGTFVTGLIGADLNGVGSNGICQNVKIIPIKVYNDATETMLSSDIIRAMNYVINTYDAKIINLSTSTSTTDYLNVFNLHPDVLFVISAGNNNLLVENDQAEIGIVGHPNNVIVVGSSTSTDAKSSSSNYSSTNVELFAPGSNVYSLKYTGGIRTGSGTSFAAPMVTAAAALIMSHATHLTASEVRQIIMNNSTTVTALNGLCISGKRLSLNGIITYLYENDPHRTAYTKGDVNGDGQVTSTDYTLCKRHYLGTYTLTGSAFNAADINSNGVIDSTDYLKIQRYYYQTYYFPPY